MTAPPPDESPPWAQLGLVVGASCLVLGGTFLLPRVPLDGTVAWAASWLTDLGGVYGTPVVTLVVAGIYLSRPGVPGAARRREAGVLFAALIVILGVFAWLNEFVVKRSFRRPRPNILELEAEGRLGMSAEEFYALGDRDARGAYLASILSDVPEAVRGHWIRETGYSFPSGHSLASMTLATCFAALGLVGLSGARRWAMLLLVPWALIVCYTRPLLRVHAPLDVLVGGGLGVCAGLTAAWLTHRLAYTGPPVPLGATTPAEAA